MSQIFVPPKVARELAEETRRYEADIDRVCHSDATCERWTYELRKLDPYLRMVKAPERPVLGLALVAGAYHIVRDNPTAPVTVTPVVNNEGLPMEPPGSLLEKLKGTDLQNAQVRRMREQVAEAERVAAVKQDEVDTERRVETAMEHWRARTQTRISFDPDHRWTQNAAGRKAASQRKAG